MLYIPCYHEDEYRFYKPANVLLSITSSLRVFYSFTTVILTEQFAMSNLTLFSRTLLHYIWLMSSVTSFHPGRDLNFSEIFAPPNSSGTRTVCVKIWGKNSKAFQKIVQVKYKGDEKLTLSTNISLYFENGTKYSNSYNGIRMRTRMRSVMQCGAISNNLE